MDDNYIIPVLVVVYDEGLITIKCKLSDPRLRTVVRFKNYRKKYCGLVLFLESYKCKVITGIFRIKYVPWSQFCAIEYRTKMNDASNIPLKPKKHYRYQVLFVITKHQFKKHHIYLYI